MRVNAPVFGNVTVVAWSMPNKRIRQRIGNIIEHSKYEEMRSGFQKRAALSMEYGPQPGEPNIDRVVSSQLSQLSGITVQVVRR